MPNLPRGYASFQYSKTLEDLTKGNNPWGVGAGFQVHWMATKLVRAVGEIRGDIYLEDDKVGREAPNGQKLPRLGTISTFLIGAGVQAGPYANVGVMSGVAFTDGRAHFIVKPTLYVFLNRRQSTFVQLAYTHVNERGRDITKDFVSYSIGIGLKVF